VIVDVVEYGQELEDKCLIECLDEGKLGRSRAMARRLPAQDSSGFLVWGSIASARVGPSGQALTAGVLRATDSPIRTYTAPAPASPHRTLCSGRNDKPRFEYAKHDPDHLGELLVDLDPAEEDNFPILGRMGSGKSMFIKAFHDCVKFGTLDDAMWRTTGYVNMNAILYILWSVDELSTVLFLLPPHETRRRVI